MKVGTDLRVLQIGHQYRGIGEVVRRSLNGLFRLALTEPELGFVGYAYDDEIDPLQFLEIPEGLEFELITLSHRVTPESKRSVLDRVVSHWQALYGDAVPEAERCDVFLQFFYGLGVPRHPPTVVVAHDIIPYIFWSDYAEIVSPKPSHRTPMDAVRSLLRPYEYRQVLRRSMRDAARIVCVSEHTKRDLHRYLGVAPAKMTAIHLGATTEPLGGASPAEPTTPPMPTKPYLLYVGGDDPRRRVDDLVAAFNNLKADGYDLQLILAGEAFRTPEAIFNAGLRREVLTSSYRADILALGYVDDVTKQALFRGALAFVFPSLYEGFGIPVLEAMLFECPVIAYRSSAVREVGGSHPLYAVDWSGIYRQVQLLLEQFPIERQQLVDAAKAHALRYTWAGTVQGIYAQLLQAAAAGASRRVAAPGAAG